MRYLAGRFSYLDLVFQDTPVSDNSTFEILKRLINSKDLDDRFQRVTAFLLYLHAEEEKEYAAITSMSESLPLRKRLIPEKLQELQEDQEDKDWILSGVNRRRAWTRDLATPYTDKEL